MRLFANKVPATVQETNVEVKTLIELTPIEVDSVYGGRMIFSVTDTGQSCDYKQIWVY